MSPPVVHLYALCWNEERMLPFFFEHYDRFVDRYVIYDDHSTDGSQQLLETHPRVRWQTYDVEGDSFLEHATLLYNTAWKQSRGVADWVIVCNIDELIGGDVSGALAGAQARGVTVARPIGYEMVSVTFPRAGRPIDRSVRRGVRREKLSKPEVFRPDRIDEIGFTAGRHRAEPVGDVMLEDLASLQLRHYKWLGYRYARSRARALAAALRPGDRAILSNRYDRSTYRLARSHLSLLRRARRVPDPDSRPMLAARR